MQNRFRSYKTSSIIITHDVDCARAIANRMILLIDGKIMQKEVSKPYKINGSQNPGIFK